MVEIDMLGEFFLERKIEPLIVFSLMLTNGIIFLPPSELVLFKVAQQISSESLLPAYAFFGTWLSGLAMYYLGIFLSGRKAFLPFLQKVKTKGEKYLISDRDIFWPLLYGRITPGIRSQVPLFAAIIGVKFTTFIIAHTIGSIIWVSYWVLISIALIKIGSATGTSNKYMFMIILILFPIIHYRKKILYFSKHIFKKIRP